MLQPLPANLREFGDTDRTRANIYKGTLDAVAKRFPVEDDDYRIDLINPQYTGPQQFSLKEQKQALLKDRRLHTPITGTWKLTHKPTGQVVEEREDVVMNVPYYSSRGTFINNGSEYSMINQMRLRPGTYIRKQRTGEIEAHMNIRPGKGRPMRVHLDPETGVFKIEVGKSSLPLYPLLKQMGVSDKDMIKSWGADMVAANAQQKSTDIIPKFYERIAGYKADPTFDEAAKLRYVMESLPNFEMDADVNARTLGLKDARGITPEVMLRTAQKMLAVSRGEEDPDDRDAPQFSEVLGVEDLVRERVDKDAGKLTQALLRKVKRAKSLKPLARGALNPYLESLLLGSGLAMPLEETNPLHTLEQLNRITKLGEGGIGSAEAITDEARDVNPGQFGFIDPITGPEGLNIGIDVRTGYRTFKGDDRKLYAEFKDRAGKNVYLDPAAAADAVVAFPGQDLDHTEEVYAMKRGKLQRVNSREVDYEVPSFAHMFSPNTNLNPMPTAVQAGRQFYGSKFWSQYMPQVKGEVPLVDSLMPDGKSTFSEHYGRNVGTVAAAKGGVVTKVTDDTVTVTDDDGKKHVTELVRDFPFNRLSAISYFPTVKAGDKVAAGDMLAHSNFTDPKTGALTLGQNMKVAIIPYKGKSFEDAVVISESAAKRLSTERLLGFDADARHGVQLGRGKYMSAFPKSFTRDQFANLDEEGVVKAGTVVNKGDPLIVAVGPRLLTSADAQLGKLHKVMRNSFTDKSQVWEYDWPGTVTDAVLTRNGAKVNVKTTPPVAVGDKLSTRFGLKGVVGSVVSDDMMPRDAATNEPYEMLMNPMAVLSRLAPGQIIEMTLGKIARKTGKQVRIPQLPPKEGWAKWAQQEMEKAGVSETADVFDPDTGKTIKGIGDGTIYLSAFHHLAEKKVSARGEAGGYTADEQPARGGYSGGKKFCFTADQPLRLLGGEDTIGHIVEKRIPALVWAPDDTGKWSYRRITNWFVRKGHVSEVLTVKVAHLPCAMAKGTKRIGYDAKVLHPTVNHEIYTANGKVRAGSLKPGDWVSSYGYVPTPDQWDILHGSMLGDASICNLADPVNAFYSDMHSDKQTAYIKWKYEMLGTLVSNRSLTSKKSGGFPGSPKRVAYVTIHRPDIVDTLRKDYYPDGIKRPVCTNLSDLALAVWFLDDGSCGVYGDHVSAQGNIATHGFTAEDNDRLAAYLSSMTGTMCTVNAGNAIYLPAAACEYIAGAVARYVPLHAIPESKTWLRQRVQELASTYRGVNNRATLGTIDVPVLSVAPYNDPKPSADGSLLLYDIEVEGVHRYCASDVVVSNSSMDVNAALAHGATALIKDVVTVRGTKNEEFWKALKLGRPLPEPKVPFIYNKFLNTLRAGGINVREQGDITKILPMTDNDVTEMSKGAVENSNSVDQDFEPVTGGLFDPGRTGGANGTRWTHIELPEPVPNPVMEEPVRRLLGLTVSKMEDVLSGREQLDGKTGGPAIKAALDKIDIDDMINEQRQKVRTLRGASRDNAVKILGYLGSAKAQGIHPSQWMITKVPVLPPVFRPVSRMGDVALSADINELYRDVIENAKSFQELKKDLPESELTEERLNLYKSVSAAFGLGEAITPEGQSKRLKGAIRQVIGDNPKTGMYQSKVLSKPVDVVGRGVVTPDPNLDMDQLGIPEDTAWALYKPFVMRALVQRGYPSLRASEMIEARENTAASMLTEVMQKRPVIMDRAPTWHKFNLMAFYPHVAEGHTIRVSPLVTKGFNMDFDGDQANFHVPVSDKAVEQARDRMLPSANLISLTDLRSIRHAPTMEMTYGLYQLTREPNKKPLQRFRTKKDAQQAYREGKISANDPIEIMG